ncbi:hypothetical protein AVEN_268526-1 [Araneus ventricosus]|uniref:CCHC-type domain-containing protein n=1 Tax=Araneus ventricosus TaxID=182803 RepID=A0A4Y2I5U0_ARAVE|nr:hypothetical protein AVEN_268526-1 [Araneus ventricosus]
MRECYICSSNSHLAKTCPNRRNKYEQVCELHFVEEVFIKEAHGFDMKTRRVLTAPLSIKKMHFLPFLKDTQYTVARLLGTNELILNRRERQESSLQYPRLLRQVLRKKNFMRSPGCLPH